jgi:hypothetical protein
MLSRLTMANRPLPAGPVDHLEGPQLQGPRTLRYAVAVGVADGYALADDAFSDLPVVSSLGGGRVALEASMLSVAGAELSALRRAAGGALEIRVFNPGGTPTKVELRRGTAGPDNPRAPEAMLRGQLVDLRGRYVASFEGSFELGPYRIATARLAEDDA